MMSVQDAEYTRWRRRAPSIPARNPFFGAEFPRQAIDSRHLEQLPWPRNLFGELATIAELMAESERDGQNTDGLCVCGCREKHGHNVSPTSRNHNSPGFDVIWFRSETCENQERMRRQTAEI